MGELNLNALKSFSKNGCFSLDSMFLVEISTIASEICEKEFSNIKLEGYGKERLFNFLAERFFSFYFEKYTKTQLE